MADEQTRRERLRLLAAENERRRTRPAIARELAERLGQQVSADDFLAHDAIEQSWRAVEEQARYHLVWHRIWGERLATEVALTVRALADRLDTTDAYLLTRGMPRDAVCVPAGLILRDEAGRLSHQTDLVLISSDRASGLLLTYDHLSHADEYSLLTWGLFAIDLGS